MTLQTQSYQSPLPSSHDLLSSWHSPFLNTQPFLNITISTYINQSNIANTGIRSFDDKNHSLGGVADERLTQIWRTGVELFEKLRLVEEVCSWYRINIHYFAINWCMPVMVEHSTEKCLKSSSSLKQCPISSLQSSFSEHISQRVKIVFQPKWITRIQTSHWLFFVFNRSWFTAIQDNIIIFDSIWCSYSKWSLSFFELSQKELVPVFKTIVRFTWITFFVLRTNNCIFFELLDWTIHEVPFHSYKLKKWEFPTSCHIR